MLLLQLLWYYPLDRGKHLIKAYAREEMANCLTYNRNTSQWSHKSNGGESIGCEVAHLSKPQEGNPTPPQLAPVVGLLLCLANQSEMSAFLQN